MNKWLLVAVLVGVAVATSAGLWLLSGGPTVAPVPVVPSPGEALRLRPAPAAPVLADAAEVLGRWRGLALPPGDAALRTLLETGLAGGGTPSFKLLVDVPFSENAGPELRDEVRSWVERKMAGLGFVPAQGRPTVMWRLGLDPQADGQWSLSLQLRAEGEASFEGTYGLPGVPGADRLDGALGGDFSAPADGARSAER